MMHVQGCCRANLQSKTAPVSTVAGQGDRPYPVSPVYQQSRVAGSGEQDVTGGVNTSANEHE